MLCEEEVVSEMQLLVSLGLQLYAGDQHRTKCKRGELSFDRVNWDYENTFCEINMKF